MMFRKFSNKIKTYIFIVLSIIGILAISYSAYANRNNIMKKFIVKKQSSNTNKSNEKITNSNSNSSTKSTKSDTNKNLNTNQSENNDKQKQLSDECEQGKQTFLNGDYTKAVSIADDVLSKDPNSYEAYNIKGIAQSYLGSYTEGIKNIDKALEIKPDFAYGRFNKALSYELQGSYINAIDWYNKDLEIEDNVWSYYGIASIYGRKGDIQNVVKYLTIVFNKNPEVKENARSEKDFDNVRKYKEFQDLVK